MTACARILTQRRMVEGSRRARGMTACARILTQRRKGAKPTAMLNSYEKFFNFLASSGLKKKLFQWGWGPIEKNNLVAELAKQSN